MSLEPFTTLCKADARLRFEISDDEGNDDHGDDKHHHVDVMKDCRWEDSKPKVLSLILLRGTNDLQGLGCPTGTLKPACQHEDQDGDIDDADAVMMMMMMMMKMMMMMMMLPMMPMMQM